MATISEDIQLFDDANGAPTDVSADEGQEVDILEEKKAPATDELWVKVRLKNVDGQPEGWVPSTNVDKSDAAVLLIDKDDFAQECMRQADRFEINGHYLLGVAQLRSQITDGPAGDETGPFRYTQAEWDAHRIDESSEVKFEAHDIRDWRSQCVISALRTYRDQESYKLHRNGQQPSAVELYLTGLVGAKVCAALLDTPATKIDAALAAVAAEDLPGGAGNATQIIERDSALLKKGKRPASGSEIMEQLATALQAAVDSTRDLAIKAGAVVLPDADAPTVPDGLPSAILMRRATFPGAAIVKGHLVEKVQRALIKAGHLPPTDNTGDPNDDGQFGPRTEDALKQWQTANGLSATGALTFEQWAKLTGEAAPEIYERCAQLTAAFEGTNFGGVNKKDFDDTVVTFGYHGYTLTGGSLRKFLKEVDKKLPGVLDAAFGADKAATLRKLFPPTKLAQAVKLGKATFLSGKNVKPGWLAAFKEFGEREEIKDAQLAFSKASYWKHGEQMRTAMQLAEPLSHALCFDVAIQNGPKLAVARASFKKFTPSMGEREKRQLFGEAIVAKAKDEFKTDVRRRKVDTLGDGAGVVHGGEYRLVDWGFGLGEAAESDDTQGGHIQVPSNNIEFSEWFGQNLSGTTEFSAGEFLFKGARHAINHLNTDPPRNLWPNIVELVRVLAQLKHRLGNPTITFNSVYRSPRYNGSVGGAKRSQHLEFRAADIVVQDGGTPRDWARALRAMRDERIFKGGIGLYRSFVHVDTRGFNADWAG